MFFAQSRGWGSEILKQGLCGDAGGVVGWAELPGSGSRSAVFLIHAEVSGLGIGRCAAKKIE
jgi:hypothetical protein